MGREAAGPCLWKNYLESRVKGSRQGKKAKDNGLFSGYREDQVGRKASKEKVESELLRAVKVEEE